MAMNHSAPSSLLSYVKQKSRSFLSPPYTTHLLQPFDVVISYAYKHDHWKAHYNVLQLSCQNFKTVDFLPALPKTRAKTFSESNTLSGWLNVGISSLNSQIALAKVSPDETVI